MGLIFFGAREDHVLPGRRWQAQSVGMKIGRKERLAALAHQDPFVRNGLLSACLAFHQTDLATTREVMKAVDEFGLEDAYDLVYKLGELELDQEASEWVRGLVEGMDGKSYFGTNATWHCLKWLIAKSPAGFLKESRDWIDAVVPEGREFRLPEVEDVIAERERLGSLPDEEILRGIEDHLATLGEDTDFADAKIPMMEKMVAGLDGREEQVREKVLDSLKETVPNSDGEFLASDWDFGVWVLAAGHLKIEEAVPFLLEGMKVDWDWLNEEIPLRLAMIGTGACLEQTAKFYEECFEGPDEFDFLRLFLGNVFGYVESPLSAKLAMELLKSERDDYNRVKLAEAVAIQLDGESMEAALKVFQESPGDPERRHLARYFYTHALLTGEERSEMKSWRTLLEKDAEELRELTHLGYRKGSMMDQMINQMGLPSEKAPEWLSDLSRSDGQRLASTVTYSGETPYVREEKKVGRNEPCPCGRGKKFKKCCGR